MNDGKENAPEETEQGFPEVMLKQHFAQLKNTLGKPNLAGGIFSALV